MSEVTEIECSLCGREGGAYPGCSICKGGAQSQSRAYTLTERRAGRVKEEPRYGDEGNTAPKTSDPLWVGTDTANH